MSKPVDALLRPRESNSFRSQSFFPLPESSRTPSAQDLQLQTPATRFLDVRHPSR